MEIVKRAIQNIVLMGSARISATLLNFGMEMHANLAPMMKSSNGIKEFWILRMKTLHRINRIQKKTVAILLTIPAEMKTKIQMVVFE